MSNKDLKYKNKYLKYKNKYLDLQSQIDRSSMLDVENYSTVLQIIKQDPFKNLLGQLNKELYTQDKDIKNKYHQKYLKYKNKYLYLQSIIGGGPKLVLLPLNSVQRLQRLRAEQALRTARSELEERLEKEEKIKKKKAEIKKEEEKIKEKKEKEEKLEKEKLEKIRKKEAEIKKKEAEIKKKEDEIKKEIAFSLIQQFNPENLSGINKKMQGDNKQYIESYKKKLLIASFNETTLETLLKKKKISAINLPINLMKLLLNELNKFTQLDNLEIMEINGCVLDIELFNILNQILLKATNLKKLIYINFKKDPLLSCDFINTALSKRLEELTILIYQLNLEKLYKLQENLTLQILFIDIAKITNVRFLIQYLNNKTKLTAISLNCDSIDDIYNILNNVGILGGDANATTPHEASPETPSETPHEAPHDAPSEAPPAATLDVPPVEPPETPPETPSETPPETQHEAPSEAPPDASLDVPPVEPPETPPVESPNITTLKELKLSRTDDSYYLEFSKLLDEQKLLLTEKLTLLEKLYLNYLYLHVDNVLVNVLNNTNTLKILNINYIYNYDDIIHKHSDALMKNKTLTQLSIGNNYFSLSSVDKIAEIIKNNKTLTSIDLNNICHDNDDSRYDDEEDEDTQENNNNIKIKKIIEALGQNDTLKKLNFSFNFLGTQKDMLNIPVIQAGNGQVTLYWHALQNPSGYGWMIPGNIDYYIRLLNANGDIEKKHKTTSNTTITFDNLDNDQSYYCELTIHDYQENFIYPMLTSEHVLLTEIPEVTPTKETLLEKLLNVVFPIRDLKKKNFITELNLAGTICDIKDIEIITKFLSDKKRVNMLTNLNLDYNKLTDEALQIIAPVLNNTKLTNLSMSYNFFSIKGVLTLISNLKDNKKLTELKLLYNRIKFNEKTILELLNFLKYNRSLKLYLHGIYFNITEILETSERKIIHKDLDLLEQIRRYLGSRIFIDMPFNEYQVLDY
jgi:hypothetical protein